MQTNKNAPLPTPISYVPAFYFYQGKLWLGGTPPFCIMRRGVKLGVKSDVTGIRYKPIREE
jgi:hypothetical protein